MEMGMSVEYNVIDTNNVWDFHKYLIKNKKQRIIENNVWINKKTGNNIMFRLIRTYLLSYQVLVDHSSA